MEMGLGQAGGPDRASSRGLNGALIGSVYARLCSRMSAFGSKAEMCSAKRHVRFTPESGRYVRLRSSKRTTDNENQIDGCCANPTIRGRPWPL